MVATQGLEPLTQVRGLLTVRPPSSVNARVDRVETDCEDHTPSTVNVRVDNRTSEVA
jgi:hypothetical protein